MTTYRIPLPWTSPPLSANQRLHRMHEVPLIAKVRSVVGWNARKLHIPRQEHIIVALHYAPRHSRKRDPSNLLATQKPAVDGLVDAGVVPDDTPQYVTELMPTIHPPNPTDPGMWLEITPKEAP